jgi:transcriptional regulator with XRE-family HTH domain
MVDSAMPYTQRTHGERTHHVLVAIGRTAMLARLGHGLSQRRLEGMTGVDQTTICRLENGKAPGLRLDKLARIIAVLGVDRFDRLQPPRPVRPPDD